MLTLIHREYPLLDSNILIDYFLESKNLEIIEQILQSRVYVTLPVIVETLNFIKNKSSAYQSVQTAKFIYGRTDVFHFFPYIPDFIAEAIDIMDKYKSSGLSFTDCILLKQAEVYNLKLLTQDKLMFLYPGIRIENPIK